MKKDKLLSLVGDFTWDFGCNFFIETAVGNFVWSDPSYTGNNTFRRFNGTHDDYVKSGYYGRSKGKMFISEKCGESFVLVSENGTPVDEI